MPLTIGSRLDFYKITGVIGAGGMGEIYRAHDTKLGREVAIKVLPALFSGDRERLRRFEQEARAAAALNHPNILAVFQMGTYEDAPYLVLELLVGNTLRTHLQSGPFQHRKAIDCGVQIARGLAAAHDKGIVHRDLKPENLFVSPEGRVKILDFGLAKLIEPNWSVDSATSTITFYGPTEPGTLMGTAGYMAPEQVNGKAADHRADIFAFGAVLYEMLTGKRAFHKATPVETMSAILSEDPPSILDVAPETPPALQRIVERCLAKNPKERFQSASDLAFTLETLSDSGRVSAATGAAASPRQRHRKWPAIAASGMGLLLVIGFIVWITANRTSPAIENPLVNAQFTRLTDFTGNETNPAISPDGKFVAVVSNRSGMFDIWVVQTNGSGLVNLTNGRIGDARAPVRAIGFSADGSEVWSGGTESRKLILWPMIGGSPHNFMDDHAAEVGWSPDGSRLVYHTWDAGDPMFVADRNGTNPHRILRSEAGMHNHFPTWSNDGQWIYFVHGRPATGEMDLWRISPDGRNEEQLSHFNLNIAYPAPIDDRTVLFVSPSEAGIGPWLWAFDLKSRTAHRVSSGLEQYTSIASTVDGRRLAATIVNPQVSLWSVPITNHIVEEKNVEPYSLPSSRAWGPRFGNGSLFYLSSRDGADGLWSYHSGQALEVWDGANGPLQLPPAISKSGKSVAFALVRNGKRQMHVMAADGSGLQALSSDLDVRGAASWSPDEKWIVVAGLDAGGQGLFKLPIDGGPPVRILSGPYLDPVWSPKGDLIVYCGTQTFTVTPLLGVHPDGTPVTMPDIKVQRDGERVRFLPDGTGLVYMLGNTLSEQDFWLLDLRTMHSRRLTRLSNPAAMPSFDISPDGTRIVFDRLRENAGVVLIDLARNGKRP